MTRPARLSRLGSAFETLEDRALPTTFGVPWADPEHLTLSFVADGTPTPVGSSSLSRVLAAAGTDAARLDILRGFQTWVANANVNIGLVGDSGDAIGTNGAVQGDSRFGDIRVAAGSQTPDVLATASPFSYTGTTQSGDLIFNANAPFGGTGYDLYSVAVHEAGHTLGLGHAGEDGGPAAGDSVMNETYSRHTGLGATDVAAIQSLYGARRADAFEGTAGNDTAARASAIPRASSTALVATADLTTATDVDYYKFTAPALTSSLSTVTVRLKAEGLSLLTAKVTVFDSAGRTVASAASTNPLDNDLQLSFRPGLFGGNYTVKVEGARGDVFDVGAYKLAVDFLSVGGLLTPLTTTVGGVLDGGTNDTLATALGVQSNGGGDARFDAVYRGVIETRTDVDTYRVHTDKFAAGTPVTLNVMVWGLDASAVDARVKVYDASGTPVAFQVLANSRGLFSVQVLNATAGRDYFVQVSAREGATQATGTYFFAADFNQHAPLAFDSVASGKAADALPAATLTVSTAGLFQFALGARTGGAVAMTVYDASGKAVLTLNATAGLPPVTAGLYLNAGTYTVKYTGTADYDLFLLQLSEAVGPYRTSTASTSSSTAPSSSSTTTSSSSTTTTSSSSTTSTSTTSTSSPPPSSDPSYTYSGDSTSKSSGYYYTY